ncbi:MAG: Stp1/IreP family PP2C-type Ser/Thr phosphatase [Pseudomonadota bacterium]
MNQRTPLDIASLSDPGMLRSHNEDMLATDAGGAFVILADGMGGYNAGEVASEMAVTELSAALAAGAGGASHKGDLLRDAVERINAAIHDAAVSRPGCAGMGSTLVAAMFHNGKVSVAHVGDSRMYRWREGRLEQITRDHSLLQEQLDGGLITPEEAHLSRHKNLVTRALGVEPSVVAEVNEYTAAVGDLYLLCSDGLSDMVGDDIIAALLLAHGADLTAACAALVAAANQNGGRDNVSVVLARVLAPARARSRLARLFAWPRLKRGAKAAT